MPETRPRTCQRLREQLPEYAEGKLHGTAATEVARHLVACPRCTQEVADLRAILGALHEFPAEELPRGLVAGIKEAVGRRAPSRGAAPFWSRLALPATVATGVLAVLVTLHTLEQNSDRLPGQRAMRGPIGETPVRQELRGEVAVPKAAPAADAPVTLGGRGPSATTAAPATAQSLGNTRGQKEQPRALETAPPSVTRSPVPESPSGKGAEAAGAPAAGLAASGVPERPARGAIALPPVSEGFASPGDQAEEGREAATGPRASAAVAQDQAAGVEPGPGGSARASKAKGETGPNAEHAKPQVVAGASGRAAGGGGRGGGGAGRGSGGVGGFARPRHLGGPEFRPGPPYPGRRGQRPGPHNPSHLGAGRGGPRGGRAPSGRAPAPRQAVEGQPAAGPPQIALTRLGQELAVVLQLSAPEGGGRLSVQVAGREVGSSGRQIVLLAEGAAGKASALPVTITSERGTRRFTLYAPSFSRLGQLQEGSALRRYRRVPLAAVLSDVSRRAGLVLLVEGPTDREVNGDLMLDLPQAAVETLAKYAGYTVRTHDSIVYTLSLGENGS